MVNAGRFLAPFLVLVLAAAVLTAGAWNRSAEYDEQYTLFLIAGTARPVWPETPVPVAAIRAAQTGRGALPALARDLRRTDVHPPLYFLAVSGWRALTGDGLFATRLLSVGLAVGALAAVGTIALRLGVSPV